MGKIIRETTAEGRLTGRIIQFHPGGGRYGLGAYWKVSSGIYGTIRTLPRSRRSLLMSERTATMLKMIEAIQLLAAGAHDQIRSFPSYTCAADEIASRFMMRCCFASRMPGSATRRSGC
jgi:hypothetical protein